MTTHPALEYVCPRCDASVGQPCISRGASGKPAGVATDHPHRDRRRLVPRPVPQCGTYSGYQHHKHRSEPACDPCLQANREYQAKYRSAPEVAAKVRRENNARTRAAWRLVDRYRDEFRALLLEEMSR